MYAEEIPQPEEEEKGGHEKTLSATRENCPVLLNINEPNEFPKSCADLMWNIVRQPK